MASELLVRSVRRHGDHTIHYLLDHGSEGRKLTLFHEAPLSAALVTDGKDVPLALLFAIPQTPKQPERRLLFRFGAKEEDDLTTTALQPTFIQSLRLPVAQRQPHFKDSADFALNRIGPEVKVVDTTPQPAHAIAKDSLKDAFCKPSLDVQINSALNGCFRSICDYIECKEKNPLDRCFDEVKQVSAICAAIG